MCTACFYCSDLVLWSCARPGQSHDMRSRALAARPCGCTCCCKADPAPRAAGVQDSLEDMLTAAAAAFGAGPPRPAVPRQPPSPRSAPEAPPERRDRPGETSGRHGPKQQKLRLEWVRRGHGSQAQGWQVRLVLPWRELWQAGTVHAGPGCAGSDRYCLGKTTGGPARRLLAACRLRCMLPEHGAPGVCHEAALRHALRSRVQARLATVWLGLARTLPYAAGQAGCSPVLRCMAMHSSQTSASPGPPVDACHLTPAPLTPPSSCRGSDAAIASSIRSAMERQRQMSLPVAVMKIAAAHSHPNLFSLSQVRHVPAEVVVPWPSGVVLIKLINAARALHLMRCLSLPAACTASRFEGQRPSTAACCIF